MLELFFASQGIVHMELISKEATVNKTRYKEILRLIRESIRRKGPELWRRKNWILLHDNAPAHRSILVQEINVLSHNPYSSDLAPCYFDLFPHLIAKLGGGRFYSPDEIITVRKDALREMSVNANIFQTCFQLLYKR